MKKIRDSDGTQDVKAKLRRMVNTEKYRTPRLSIYERIDSARK